MPDAPPPAATKLPRVLGPWMATAIVIGTVIGSGVFKKPQTVAVRLRPNRAVRAAAMGNAMRYTAQRHRDAVSKAQRYWQATQACRDPAAVLLRELARFFHRAARRHGKNDLPRCGGNAERIAARLTVPPYAHEIDRSIENNFDGLRLARPTVKQRAVRHNLAIPNPTQHRILPHPMRRIAPLMLVP